MHLPRYTLFLAALAALALGCAGELEDPERFTDCPPGFTEEDLFVNKCSNQACHGSEGVPAAGLDLVSADLVDRLIDVPGSAACGERLLIDSSQPEDSLLLDKLMIEPVCGTPMPLAAPALTAFEIECVKRWIDEVLEQDASARGAL